MRHRARLAGLALLGPVLLAGCGEDAPPRAAGGSEGAPRWSLAPSDGGAGTLSIDLKADAACRVRVLVASGEGEPQSASERVLAVGETTRLWWRAEGRRAPADGAPASVADHQAGRTETWVVDLTFGWQDDAAMGRSPVVGTRPGRGRVLGRVDALPPVRPTALAYDTDLELCAVGIADGGSPDLTLAPGAHGARVKGTLDAGADDRVQVVRLLLRLEKVRP